MSKVFKSMKYNGISLAPYIAIKKITRPPTAEITNETKHIALRGLSLTRRRFGGKVIKVDAFIKSNVLATIDKLNSIFSEQEKKIEFDDQPDRYYIVCLQSLGEPSSSVRNADITITFLSVDGVAHSVSYKKITNYRQDGKKLLIDITNNGNVDAHPIITVKHNADNGYLAFVDRLSVFEIGDLEEYDKEDVKHSETLVNFKDGKLANMLTSGAKNVAILNDNQQTITGSLGQKTAFDRNHIYLANAGSGQGIHGASLTFDVPADSVGGVGSINEVLWARQIFWPLNVNECGFIKLAVSDTDGKFLYGSEVVKRSNGQRMEYNVSVSTSTGFETIFAKTFNANDYNPFYHKQGWSEIARNNDELDIYYWGSRYKVSAPTLKDRKALKVHVFLGAVGDRPVPVNMFIDGLYIKKNFTNLQEDVPNTFSTGSEVVLNSENDTLLVDGVPKNNKIVDGFISFPKIPPGTSTFEVSLSSWATANPDITLSFEERWL
ncbi:distal tail protein Dit [Streptococcus dysgalactiae]|uniref:Phage tail protein n=1 Tax=Streptococcus dysgalactiae subsp. equisimilis TaxID=119602 RepID=A0AAE9R033_STREQ|nr:distal tail protein Dit [Streptococcus dysgalactiae]VTT16040.1 phage tail protein [Streptococcus dysgalactiae]VTT25691.1 phage tail protein [Streptococcus dysgalactiae subsp. equisimilis]